MYTVLPYRKQFLVVLIHDNVVMPFFGHIRSFKLRSDAALTAQILNRTEYRVAA